MAGGSVGEVTRKGGLDWDGAEDVLPEGGGGADVFLIRAKDHIRLVRHGTIDWVGAEGNYCCLYVGRAVHLVRRGIGELEKRLKAALFLRINRSAIVNLDRVERLVPWFNGGYMVRLTTGKELRLTTRYAQELFRRIGRPL